MQAWTFWVDVRMLRGQVDVKALNIHRQVDVKARNIHRQVDVKLNELAKQILMLLLLLPLGSGFPKVTK